MKRLILTLFILAAASLTFGQESSQLPTQAPAEIKDEKPELKTGFTVFMGYFWNPSTIQKNSTNFNSFYFERAYIDFKVDFKNSLKLRITPDVNETTNGWVLRLKYAYAEYEILKGITLNGGITKTEWAGYVDDFLGTRYITKTAPDLYKIRSTADLGFGVYIRPVKGLNFMFSVYDGNGFGSGSDSIQTNTGYINVTKNLGTRFEVWPFYFVDEKLGKSLVVSLFSYNTIIPSNDMDKASGLEFYGAGLGLDYSHLKLFVDYATFNNVKINTVPITGNYFEIIGKLDFSFVGLKEIALVGAYYIYEPNNAIPGDDENYVLAGVEYVVNKNLTVSLNLKNSNKESAYKDFNGNTVSDQTLIYFNTQVKL